MTIDGTCNLQRMQTNTGSLRVSCRLPCVHRCPKDVTILYTLSILCANASAAPGPPHRAQRIRCPARGRVLEEGEEPYHRTW